MFAEREGINYCTFIDWLQRARQRGVMAMTPAAATPRFQELNLAAMVPAKTAMLEVKWPGGMTVRWGKRGRSGRVGAGVAAGEGAGMLTLPPGLKIYLAVEPVDMRNQYNGLWALAESKLQENPRSGALFVFSNKTRDRLKLMDWDGTGVWSWRSDWKRGG